jgi:hypothetical protein
LATPPAERSSSARTLGILLTCFDAQKSAANARKQLEAQLRAAGAPVLETTVLQVDADHKASVYDPRRVVAGALTAALTWGVFGLVSGGVPSLIVSAVLGAAWGGWVAHHLVHHASKGQLVRLGEQLRAPSSVLLTFAEANNPGRLLESAANCRPSAVSAALIADDLTAQVLTGNGAEAPAASQARPADVPASADGSDRMRMIVVRYPDSGSADKIAAEIAAGDDAADRLEVELVESTETSGRRHVTDPKFGASAIGKYNVHSWGVLGLACGALAGITGGGGLLGILQGSIITAVAWGLFGLAAGALYGLWVGRAISSRRLKPIAPLAPPGTSTLVAWSDKPLSEATSEMLNQDPAARQLVLGFKPTGGGAVLEQL